MSNKDLPIILIDTREKQPWAFRASKNCAGTENIKLDYGDYAIKDHLDLICIERKKSITELCGNFGKKREQFEAEMQRMIDAGVKHKYIIVEDYWSSMSKQKYNSWTARSILANIHAFEIKYNIHFIMAGSKDMARKIARSLLIKAYLYKDHG